jgi:hypothetical protein
MDTKKSKVFGALLFLPLAVLLVSTAAAQDDDSQDFPDLVITEDTQMGERLGKVVKGSCESNAPLWEGYIAIKNIGKATVPAKLEGEARWDPAAAAAARASGKYWPHVRAYVPNNIQLKAEHRLDSDLGYLGQELVELSIGEGEPKCRNYSAPPVFDENLSGRPGPINLPAPAESGGGYGWRIKAIQHALIRKGYALSSGPDGDYGPETARAVAALFRDRRERPPAGIHQRPLPPETVTLLLEALEIDIGGEVETPGYSGDDECVRGINLVPVYVEIDPERKIVNENRSNNRVQFTVAIDCSNVGKLHK